MGLACLVRCLTIIYMINLLINKLRKVLNEKIWGTERSVYESVG